MNEANPAKELKSLWLAWLGSQEAPFLSNLSDVLAGALFFLILLGGLEL